ncbi:transcriptional regulator [Cryobacterium roopkundense]|uniref:Transcriptional regulator n=1 Tax=Cryobacterium roopkundense TaxID=1001240 RepID=A0A099JBK6_9MICO|nr:GAF and ANTAR domain-containing protein [Cryobacterium roopkundense]KGJ74887.1 transcriptional regulator [Cryobacterium roopkundense]MBB5640606.1 transcriptional regulator with GAF, ATPase, and Fis domain [Cryobacterium roopkundense]
MKSKKHDVLLSTAFVEIADRLVSKYDTFDVLRTLVDHCVALLDVTAAGIVLADKFGDLQVLASTSEASQHVELLQHRAGAGPCVDAYRYGRVITLSDIKAEGDRYPAFRAAALSQGFQSVHAIPMRVRPDTIGALNLFRNDTGSLTVEDARIGQALADMATVSILYERTVREDAAMKEQLERAVGSRALIEEAEGIIAQRHNVDLDEAFRILRAYSHAQEQTLHMSAAQIITNRSLV